jgi:nondiscriminating glutamyl-tRNA synthetase
MNKKHYTRFAPSPTGLLHLGNVRAAILSYMCTMESDGKFLLRIEDTDKKRNDEKSIEKILDLLKWLKIKPDNALKSFKISDEYKQSSRTHIYEKYLKKLIGNRKAYRCFKTHEEIEEINASRAKAGLPPRIQKKYHGINSEDEKKLLAKNTPYIWRFEMPCEKITIEDKARGKIQFNSLEFSDFPIARQDGSFCFVFANLVDDIEMKITYVIRGEEHISNTVKQAALYDHFDIEKPNYYHLPLICNKEGKKLSKRDSGFSLIDLKNQSYLPEAIINYLITMGGSFKEEIFSMEDAAKNKIFSGMHSSGLITYDPQKLDWFNKKWIQKISVKQFIEKLKKMTFEEELVSLFENIELISDIKNECNDLNDAIDMLKIFITQKHGCEIIDKEIEKIVREVFAKWFNEKNHSYELLKMIANETLARNNYISKKQFWMVCRERLTGKKEGIGIAILIKHINPDEIAKRIN